MDFDTYVRRRGEALFRFAYLLSGDRFAAEDLVQTALTKSYLRWGRISRLEHPDSYVRRVLVNSHLSWRRLRSSGERPVAEPNLPTVTAGQAGDPHVVAESKLVFWALVSDLSPRARAVIVLRYYLDYGDDEIAMVMGISRGTVRSTASRALTAIRKKLAVTPETPPVSNARGASRDEGY